MSKDTGKTQGQILKSSALIGGSTVISAGLKFVRQKAVALLLGPAGIGLLGIYQSVADLSGSITGLGINSSGVRQIAEAVGTGDSVQIARTVFALRRISLILGVLGAVALAVFSGPVSRFTFGDATHSSSVVLLSLAVLLTIVSNSQAALVQGMRQIRSLAFINVLGAAFGTVLTIVIVWAFGEKGIAVSIVGVAAAAIVTSWWYARKVRVERVSLPWQQLWAEASTLTQLGVVLASSALMSLGVTYLIRRVVLLRLGPDSVGYYMAAWSIAGQYVSFILQAMAVDFYPRLTAVEKDRELCSRLVNEQAEVGLLLAGPGILATLAFAPMVIQIFFSSKFGPAIELLRWNCLGMLLRVASWPLGYLMLARNERKLFFTTALLAHSSNLILVWLLVPIWGLNGTGVAIVGMSGFDFLLMVVVAVRINGFKWSASNKKIALLLAPMVLAVFAGWYFLPPLVVFAFGAVASVVAGLYSLKTLCTLIPMKRFPGSVQRALVFFRMAPPAPLP